MREHPCRSSGSPSSACLPSPNGQWHLFDRSMRPRSARTGLQRRVHSRFSRDSLSLDVVDDIYCRSYISQHTLKVKMFFLFYFDCSFSLWYNPHHLISTPGDVHAFRRPQTTARQRQRQVGDPAEAPLTPLPRNPV